VEEWEMNVTVTFRHMDSSDALRAYAEEKSERLAKYLVEPIEFHWVLSVEKIRHIADVTVVAGGVSIKAKEDTADMYSAIDLGLDKIEKQVKKHKERVKDHKPHAEPAKIQFTEAAEPVAEIDSSAGPSIVTRENVFVKPMSNEEAVMQMGISKNQFMVFTDSATNHINVLYRLEDGDYGLIEAQKR
jgi:putative sigma-54 modulation protein